MNNDLISRSVLLETIEKSRKAHASVRSRLTVGDMEQMIKGARSVDAEVVRHGRWKPDVWRFECSVCDTWFNLDDCYSDEPTAEMNYCPNCGAKMDGGAKDA